MINLDLARLFSAKGGRPVGVGVAVGAIFLPSSLLVYLTRPDLYQHYGLAGGIFFGAAVGFPVVYVCTFPWYAALVAGVRQEKIYRRILEAASPVPPPPEPSTLEKATTDDPLEWPPLLAGGWTANLVLYGLVALAYYQRLLLGATLLLTVSIVLVVSLVLAVAIEYRLKWLERQVQPSVEHVRQAARGANPPTRTT